MVYWQGHRTHFESTNGLFWMVRRHILVGEERRQDLAIVSTHPISLVLLCYSFSCVVFFGLGQLPQTLTQMPWRNQPLWNWPTSLQNHRWLVCCFYAFRSIKQDVLICSLQSIVPQRFLFVSVLTALWKYEGSCLWVVVVKGRGRWVRLVCGVVLEGDCPSQRPV